MSPVCGTVEEFIVKRLDDGGWEQEHFFPRTLQVRISRTCKTDMPWVQKSVGSLYQRIHAHIISG